MSEGRPRTLGRYRLLSVLGEGGMGKIYRGFDSLLQRNVAIKLLPPELVAHPSRLGRFIQEACAASALNHPNVVTVYDIGEERLDGEAPVRYIAMELIEGDTLRDVVGPEPLELRHGLRIALQIAEGLAAAHAAGIVHRDLKPENVMINPSGIVKILDFGLAKLRPREIPEPADESQKTVMLKSEPGLLIGTAGYMSPEQVQGHDSVDARADVFALGCVLYEIFTGQQAFDGEVPVQTLYRIMYEHPVPMGEVRANVPVELARIVRKALEKAPAERYASAAEVAADLRALLQQVETNPESIPRTGSVARRLPQKPNLVLAIACAVAILGGLLPLVLRMRASADDAEAETIRIRRITASGNTTQAVISPDAKLAAYVTSYQNLQTLVVREMASGQTLTLIPARRSSYWGLAFTPDSSSIYFGVRDAVDEAGAIYRISTLGGRPQKIVDGMDSRPAFSPDGKQIAFLRAAFPTAEESALLIANADGSGVRTLAKVRAPEFFVPIFFAGPSWSPDGKTIATAVAGRQMARGTEYYTPEAARTSRIVAVDVADGSMETISDARWAIVAQVAWLPDQTGLVAIAMDASAGHYQVWSVPLKGEARPVTRDLFDYRTVSVSADGRSLVTVAAQINADVWTARDGAPPQRIRASRAEGMYGVAALPDGRLVTTSIETDKLDLFVMNEDGTGRTQITRDAHSNRSPVVTPDGKWIVYLSVTAKGSEICRIAVDGSQRKVLARTGVATAALDVSPDGRTVVFENLPAGNSRPGFAGLSRVSIDGGPVSRVGTENLAAPAFSPDGTRIAGLLGEPNARAQLAIVPAAGGPATIVGPWSATAYSTVRWARDGQSLIVNTVEGDHANLWQVPLDGSPRRKLTAFDEHVIFTFAPLPRGEGWVVARGDLSRDAVLITGFR